MSCLQTCFCSGFEVPVLFFWRHVVSEKGSSLSHCVCIVGLFVGVLAVSHSAYGVVILCLVSYLCSERGALLGALPSPSEQASVHS